ncbi:unnamed protein product [Pleuronectes platessa]|uniref:Uncharacterized protein n=1 Tax=Pleuronectes platessa TaxID=8262 RepID=A0A9N7YM79_PLEPL|nr:unnamed protein product [Pleuronectes platessa]
MSPLSQSPPGQGRIAYTPPRSGGETGRWRGNGGVCKSFDPSPEDHHPRLRVGEGGAEWPGWRGRSWDLGDRPVGGKAGRAGSLAGERLDQDAHAMQSCRVRNAPLAARRAGLGMRPRTPSGQCGAESQVQRVRKSSRVEREQELPVREVVCTPSVVSPSLASLLVRVCALEGNGKMEHRSHPG